MKRYHRNILEFQMSQIWRDVLDCGEVLPWDDFFELGGDSITALQVVAAMRRRLNVEVSVTQLFETRTIEALCLRVVGGPTGSKSLIEFNGSTSRSVLVFLHSASGEIFFLRDVGREVDARIIGIRAAGLDSEQDIDTSIRQMADRYVDALESSLGECSVVLVGYSLGALLALEMTRQITDSKLRVLGQILIDPPDLPAVRNVRSLDEHLRTRMGHLAEHYNLSQEDDADRVVDVMRSAGVVAPIVSDEDFRRAQRVWATNMVAADRYVLPPGQEQAPTILYRSSLTRPAEGRPVWDHYLEDLRAIREFPVDHFDFLKNGEVRNALNADADHFFSAAEKA